jgi:hypothetical protein
MNHLAGSVFGAVLAVVCCSCTSIDPLIPPEPSVVTVRFEQMTAFETRAVFTIRLSNETPVPVEVDGGSYALSLNGASLGKGMTGERVSIPRLDTATVEVPVHVNHVSLLLRAPSLLQSSRLSYEVSSILYVVEGGRTRRLKRAATGQFELPVREQQALQALAAPGALIPGVAAPVAK